MYAALRKDAADLVVTEVKAPHWIGRPTWYWLRMDALVPWL